MAKRKRKKCQGSKIQQVKDYQVDEYVPYIMGIEVSILRAFGMNTDLRDGEVRQALRDLIVDLKESDMPIEKHIAVLSTRSGIKDNCGLVKQLILEGLILIFETHPVIEEEDAIGILKMINYSVGSWGVGMHGQGYLEHINGVFSEMTTAMQQLAPDEFTDFLGV
ncbi:MAG: hypothetical protein B6242_03465 [Anaerolineaceae bacterium 4572_78]|nr:MAG: hypothetical protein B6242_03465 [Anaerolineaceae bacterium 4572_78]